RISKLIVNCAAGADADKNDVRPCRDGVVAADSLVLAEDAIGDGCGQARRDGSAKAAVDCGVVLVGTAVAVAAADGQIVVELAAGEGIGRPKGADGASEGIPCVCPNPVTTPQSGVAAESAVGDRERSNRTSREDGASLGLTGGRGRHAIAADRLIAAERGVA